MTSGSGKDFKVPNKMSLQFVHDMTRGYVLCFVLCMSDRGTFLMPPGLALQVFAKNTTTRGRGCRILP